MSAAILADLGDRLRAGTLIPYLGHGTLELVGGCAIPRTPKELVERLVKKVAVPGRIRTNLTAAAQYVESRKHRRTLDTIMGELFKDRPAPTALHRWLASIKELPLIVDGWYDGLMATALSERAGWGQARGLSHPQSDGAWVALSGEGPPEAWPTFLYAPLGTAGREGGTLVSDSDFVEVLTEIDIQTPIPDEVKDRRAGRGFLFLGVRFDHEIPRTFARQIIKRSSERHWAVIPEEPTRNEQRFMDQQGIERLPVSLEEAFTRLKGDQ